ncbi:MAG: GNAT family N-acetyltransferase [Planctomycetes bacterium]|nr:GNAT family N-acetyltransferase [Planctomycetota bacterium]
MSQPAPSPVTTIRLAVKADRGALARAHAGYLRTLFEFDATIDTTRNLEEVWFRKPGELLPFVIEVDGQAAGFLLVFGRRYAEAMEANIDYYLNDLFVEQDLRGKGIAEAAVELALGRLPGRWALAILPRNTRALAFWSRFLGARELASERGLDADGNVAFHFRSRLLGA